LINLVKLTLMLLVLLSFKEVPFSISITYKGLSQNPTGSDLFRFDLILDD
jgi:hypothetical protein